MGDTRKEAASIGDGPVDAACKAIASVTGTQARLIRYEVRAVTTGHPQRVGATTQCHARSQ